jgi:hypothetical protein
MSDIIERLTGGDDPVTRDQIEHVTDTIKVAVNGMTVDLSKFRISQAVGCEAKMVAEGSDGFAWNPRLARGTIVHKAIELWIQKPDARANDLVDWAMQSVARGERGLADWLNFECEEWEQLELASLAVATVASIQDTWPPISKKWRPVSEVKVRAQFLDVNVKGVIDLLIGTSETKAVVDWKTGNPGYGHRDDLMLYAFLDCVRSGTAPRKVATAYVDSGGLDVWQFTVGDAEHMGDRIIEAATVISQIEDGREPTTSPSAACRWCPLKDTCEDASA